MAPCSVRSCSSVKERRRADKQWPGAAVRQKSKFLRGVSGQLHRHVVCEFPFFAFGEHYAATQRLDAVATKNFQERQKLLVHIAAKRSLQSWPRFQLFESNSTVTLTSKLQSQSSFSRSSDTL